MPLVRRWGTRLGTSIHPPLLNPSEVYVPSVIFSFRDFSSTPLASACL